MVNRCVANIFSSCLMTCCWSWRKFRIIRVESFASPGACWRQTCVFALTLYGSSLHKNICFAFGANAAFVQLDQECDLLNTWWSWPRCYPKIQNHSGTIILPNRNKWEEHCPKVTHVKVTHIISLVWHPWMNGCRDLMMRDTHTHVSHILGQVSVHTCLLNANFRQYRPNSGLTCQTWRITHFIQCTVHQ